MFRLKEEKVFGNVRDPRTGAVVSSFPNGTVVALRSHDGLTWFLTPQSMLQVKRRPKGDVIVLSDREKRWIGMVELPWAGVDLRTAMRMGYRTGGAR